MRVRRWSGAAVLVAAVLVAGSARASVEALEQTGNAFRQIAKSALPAVVFINVESTVEVPRNEYYYNPLEQFFGGRGLRQAPPRKYHQEGQGSGFIISKDGYILTNNHVVNGADRIIVTTADGKKYTAKLIGTDPKSEVALIKIEDGDDLPVLPLGNSDEIEVGDWVLAAGNPFGLSQTVTAGIISAKGRSGMGITEYENFIQTDAAINPGNSGGPMLNIRGEVIGINTAIYSRTGGYMGVGFAVPINMAKNIKDQLLKTGKVSRSVLGVVIQNVDEELAKSFGMDESGGVLIAQVMEDSAAEKAGLESGDIIVEMDGVAVGKVDPFRNRVAATAPETEVKLKVFRDGKYKTFAATTQAMDGEDAGGVVAAKDYGKLGFSVDDLDEQISQQLGYDKDRGVVITEVEQGSPAWRAGLQPGQLVVSVNRVPVDSVAEFKKALSKMDDFSAVLLLVRDANGSRFVVIRAE